jgi:mannose-1-phosphate guanylyltransferase
MKAVILAGGSGQRFWPVSTTQAPKQFVKIFGRRSLIASTYDRLRRKLDPDDIYVVTSAMYTDMTLRELDGIPEENVIGEPYGRNTAPACVLGAVTAGMDDIQLHVPADHYIGNVKGFWKSVEMAENTAVKYGGLVTFGIRTRRPDTGFGYIETGEDLGEGVHKVRNFHEKPDPNIAEEYHGSDSHFWNSGMFVWKGSEFMEEMRMHAPSLIEAFDRRDISDVGNLESIYADLKPISIDHALMEKSGNVFMVEGGFDWSDLGSWLSIRDLEGYTMGGDFILLEDSDRVYIRSDMGRPVAVLGLDDILIVDTENGLLVMKEDMSQKVRVAARRFS